MRPSKRREVMLDLPHNSIKAIGEKGGHELDDGYRAGASLMAAAARIQAGGRWQCGRRRLERLAADVSRRKGKGAKYGTLGANPMVL